MPVPAGVLTDLVVVQAGFSCAGLKALLDRPPCSGGPGQLGQCYPFGSVGQVVGNLGRVGQAASGDQSRLDKYATGTAFLKRSIFERLLRGDGCRMNGGWWSGGCGVNRSCRVANPVSSRLQMETFVQIGATIQENIVVVADRFA